MNRVTPLRKTGFSEYIVGCNGLGGRFEEWFFYPGMLFNASDRWWGGGGRRDRPHEGLDLCLYRDRCGEKHRLDETTEIPVIYSGEIIRICDDFLGQSIFVGHDTYDGNGNRLYTVYGHTIPLRGIDRGKAVSEGSIIATIAGVKRGKATVPSHLHISIAWIPETLPSKMLNWKTIDDRRMVNLLDPLKVIACKYTVGG